MQKIIKVTKRIKRIWASRFAGFARSRRAIRSITFAAVGGYGGSATIPLAKKPANIAIVFEGAAKNRDKKNPLQWRGIIGVEVAYYGYALFYFAF